MGIAKAEMMRHEELEPMYDWIEENYGDDAGEEGSDTWEEAVLAFKNYCGNQQQLEYEISLQEIEELERYIYSESQIGIFHSQIINIEKLLEVDIGNEILFSLLVMLHGHVIASVEAYLASTFIHKVTSSEDLTRKLVETDPFFSKKKFTLKEIFVQQENLKLTVAAYLKDLIFHDLKKVKSMYNGVLDTDFGDISWLFEAVTTRHHCVHRAGLDKDGNKVELSVNSIKELIANSFQLVNEIEEKIGQIPQVEDNAEQFMGVRL